MKPRLKKFTHAKLPSMAKYEAILLVGSGGLLTESLFEDWKEEFGLIVVDEYANARGMLKVALIA